MTAADVTLLARRLLPCAHAAFAVVPEAERGRLCEAVDQFVLEPRPSTFLRASRALNDGRRQAMLQSAGRGVLRRAFSEGVAALRNVSSLPPPAIDILANRLPVDPRAGERLRVLASLANAYQEVSARVAADSDRRRRLWKTFPRRRPRN